MSTLAVYDCMLFFRAVSRPDRVRPLFEFVERHTVTLCLSPDVLAEIRDVLNRPKLRAKYPSLSAEAVDAFLNHHLLAAHWVNDVPEHFVLQRDPKDSKYLNLAIAANAPFLVTHDLDLLDLMQPTSVEGRDFRSRYPAIQIVTTADFESLVGEKHG